MNVFSDIAHALMAILSWVITVTACILIWVILPAGIILGTLLLLIKLLGPVIGFLAALVLSIAAGVIIQDVT
jgi:hypothetical protein